MQFIEVRDRFLDAYLAQVGPRSDALREDFLSSLADDTGLCLHEMEELVCNWMLQLAMWHRQPGFLWIDPRYEARSTGDHIEHHYGVVLSFGKSTADGVSTQRPRFSLQEFAINRRQKSIRLSELESESGVSQWASTVLAREILRAGCPQLPQKPKQRPAYDKGTAAVRLARGWSVEYPDSIELVT